MLQNSFYLNSGEICETLPLDVSFTAVITADSSGRGSQVPHTWGREKQKNTVKI